MTQPANLPRTVPTPRPPPPLPQTLWTGLDPVTRLQLAQCLCELIGRIRAVPVAVRQEKSDDPY